MAKKRKAKRYPRTRFMDIKSKKMYGMGYMEYLESLGITNRNTFYGMLKRRTLPDELADKISTLFMVKTSDWYDGKKVIEKTVKIIKDPELDIKKKVNAAWTDEDISFTNELDDII